MEYSESFNLEIEKFKKLLGYGSFRPMKERVEVRVKDLDSSIVQANRIIETNNLQIKVTGVYPQLRSFELVSK